MPIDYKKYHKEWKTRIRPDILKRANNKCEACGVENHAVGYWSASKFVRCEGHELDTADLDGHKIIRIVLTIAHLDQDIENNDYSNLKALCQKHHLQHDRKDNWMRRKYGKNYKEKQLNLEF